MFPLLALLCPLAAAAPATLPTRQIPEPVLVELQLLENRFDLALAADCAADVCSSKGCVWLDHAVADQPAASSMPGLSDEPGPAASGAQTYLTRAQCTFAHEASMDPATAQAIVQRLQTRLTRGWTVVAVNREALKALPAPETPPLEPEPVPEPVEAPAAPPPWTLAEAAHELWDALLPHAFWMVGLGLFTLAATTLIWAWRRVGRASIEEQALLAELAAPVPPAKDEPAPPPPDDADRAVVADQEARWRARLDAMDPERPDPELVVLVRDRLRAGDLTFLAKATLLFPDRLPALFPSDGETAAAKLELAELLRTGDAAALPADRDFFAALHRHALAASLSAQPDARVVRSLREDFGASGLVGLIGQSADRVGALLFALAPREEQLEMARLLDPPRVAALATELLRSNRMDPREIRAVFEVLRAARGEAPAPPEAMHAEVTDRGATFDAAGALAVLLPQLSAATREGLFDDALARTHGALPSWTRGILTPDMLLSLPAEARADLLLEVEVEPLAAWLSLVDAETRGSLLADAPEALRLSIQASSVFPSRSRQVGLADRARRDLARGFQRQLARARIPFEQVVRPAEALGA